MIKTTGTAATITTTGITSFYVFVTLPVTQQNSESWPEDLDAIVFTSIG